MSFVYFIQAGPQGPIKVGWTVDVEKRLGALQCGNHAELRLLASSPGGHLEEARCHAALRPHRLRGEWFAPHPEVFEVMRRVELSDYPDPPAPSATEPSADPINRNTPAARIIEKFGGIVAFSRALGKNPSTCHRWLVSGLIPAKHQAAVLAAAKRCKIKMRSDDFIPDLQDAA